MTDSSRLHQSSPLTYVHRLNWRTTLSAGLIALSLAGCSSGVKLNEGAPVSDHKPPQIPLDAGSSSQGGGSTAPVDPRNSRGSELDDVNAQKQMPRVLYFDYDEYSVRPEFNQMLEQHARYLMLHATQRVVLEGHTDERGGREYNLALGQKRSEAVLRALSLMGVSDEQLEAVSFGKEKPAEQGDTEAAYRLNRRVEITYR